MAEETILDGADTTEAVESSSDAVETADTAAEERDAVEVQATKTEDTDDKGDEDTGDDDTAVVPDEYEEFDLPEGVSVDKEMLDGFMADAKEIGLTQEAAQKLVNRYVGGMQALGAQQDALRQKQANDWREAIEADDELGGTDMEQKLAVANQAITQFGNNEMLQALVESNRGNHPEIVRFVYRVGKQLTQSEAKTASPASSESIVDRWYGDTSKETN